MKNKPIAYSRVDLGDLYMRYAYLLAKEAYLKLRWNKKAMPVAVLVQDGKIVLCALSGDGMHQEHGRCDRLNRPGSPYEECKYCAEAFHAEVLAVQRTKIDLRGSKLYVYGHWRVCHSCEALAAKSGVQEIVLLEGCEALFDHRSQGTVIGSPRQFEL